MEEKDETQEKIKDVNNQILSFSQNLCQKGKKSDFSLNNYKIFEIGKNKNYITLNDINNNKITRHIRKNKCHCNSLQ